MYIYCIMWGMNDRMSFSHHILLVFPIMDNIVSLIALMKNVPFLSLQCNHTGKTHSFIHPQQQQQQQQRRCFPIIINRPRMTAKKLLESNTTMGKAGLLCIIITYLNRDRLSYFYIHLVGQRKKTCDWAKKKAYFGPLYWPISLFMAFFPAEVDLFYFPWLYFCTSAKAKRCHLVEVLFHPRRMRDIPRRRWCVTFFKSFFLFSTWVSTCVFRVRLKTDTLENFLKTSDDIEVLEVWVIGKSGGDKFSLDLFHKICT